VIRLFVAAATTTAAAATATTATTAIANKSRTRCGCVCVCVCRRRQKDTPLSFLSNFGIKRARIGKVATTKTIKLKGGLCTHADMVALVEQVAKKGHVV